MKVRPPWSGDGRDGPAGLSAPTRWSWRLTVLDVVTAVATGVFAVVLFRSRVEWTSLDLTVPAIYFGDYLFYGNAVWNAQLGNAFTGRSLGAMGGQQIGLSSYGVEWFQSWFVAQLDPGGASPWRAMYRYWELSYFLTGLTCFLSLRWVGCARVPALLGSVAFTFVPQHEYNIYGLYYVNIATIPLALVFTLKLLTGAKFAQLAPRGLIVRERVASTLGGLIVMFVVLFGLTGANYHMVFVFLLLCFSSFVMLSRRRWWPRAARLAAAASVATVPLMISYGPVIIGRLSAGLTLSEESQSDRRAFAAYANGGDPFGLLLPFQTGFIQSAAEDVAVLRAFLTEYQTSAITQGTEYTAFKGGIAVGAVLLLLVLQVLGAHRRVDLLRRVSPASAAWAAGVLLLVLTALLTVRGGSGTLIAFVAPQLRGYARATTLVTFCALLLLALAASRAHLESRFVQLLALALLLLATSESVSSTDRHVQAQDVDSVVNVVSNAQTAMTGGVGFELRSLGPRGTERLVAGAETQLPDGCAVLVLPLVKYPVDFSIGLASYYAYEVVKPGLVASDLTWTSGGFTGTPGNRFADTWTAPYRDGEVEKVLEAADDGGLCGTLFFKSLHEGFFVAGPASGSQYVDPSADVERALMQRYGAPCYVEEAAQVQLYCR